MTNCTQLGFEFPSCKGRKVQASFDGGAVSSDAGALLLRQADRRLGLTRSLARVLSDERVRSRCEHSLESLIRQRVYALALGYEDLNDHETLRGDPALQTALERVEPLASASTLCRWENRAGREAAWAMHEVLIEQFIASFESAPEELVLDFDATDDVVHGKQEGRFFHGYYDHYCFLPLYVFCGEQLLVAYLRPSKIDAARHAWAILALLVKRLRAAWPGVRIVMRADSGFCRWKMLSWCERHEVRYIVGLARNERLARAARSYIDEAARGFEHTGTKQRVFADIVYGARSWDHPRRVLVKAEHTDRGANPRYLVTNLDGDPKELYETLYCARGEMENRIKEQQLDLFADRTSCHQWWPNQFRLLLSSLAYTLLEAIRRLALHGTEMARARCMSIRLKLLKVGAVIVRNTRRIRFLLASHYPFQELFLLAARRLVPP